MEKEISAAQKKIIAATVVILLIFFVVFFKVYLPAKRHIAVFKSEVFALKAQIQEIESIMDASIPVAESLKLLQEKYQRLYERFPQQEEDSLVMLSDLARRFNIEVTAIRPQQKIVFTDNHESKMEIEDKLCRVCPISIEMKCFYEDLVGYIEDIKKELPAFSTVEQLTIIREDARFEKGLRIRPRLSVYMELRLYFLS